MRAPVYLGDVTIVSGVSPLAFLFGIVVLRSFIDFESVKDMCTTALLGPHERHHLRARSHRDRSYLHRSLRESVSPPSFPMWSPRRIALMALPDKQGFEETMPSHEICSH